MRDHRYNDQRSLWLHRAVADKLRADPARVRAKGRANVERMRAVHGPTVQPYASAWASLLDGPLDDLLAAMLAETQEAVDLRHSTPFAGVLSPGERWEVYRAFGRWWSGDGGAR